MLSTSQNPSPPVILYLLASCGFGSGVSAASARRCFSPARIGDSQDGPREAGRPREEDSEEGNMVDMIDMQNVVSQGRVVNVEDMKDGVEYETMRSEAMAQKKTQYQL